MIIRIDDIDIRASVNSSREFVDPNSCWDLAASIAQHGQLVPVQVRKLPSGKWKLVYGFRRYYATCLIGLETIRAEEAEGEEGSDPLNNLIENLFREDLSFWQECVAIREVFPESASHQDVATALTKSRPWASLRRRVWELDDATLARVQSGQLGPSDVLGLLGHSEEERTATLAMLDAAERGEGEKPQIANRRHPRSIKQLRRMQTLLFDAGRNDWNALIKYSLGDIDDETLLRELNIRESV